MAKYIKFNFTDGEDLSIEINDIESVSYIDANTTQIDLNNGVSKFTITHSGALESTAVVEAVYAAMMAQTIGVYSTVKGPISVAQVIDSSSGRQLITTKEKNVTFTSYVFETVPSFVGLLDTYPNAAAAYSLRDLAIASLGSAVIRVRRSSDNTEQDFTSTEITDGTLTTFTGANDGFVTTWYDQSGNGYDLIQNSALNQPKLVVAGVVNTYLSKPSILADGSDYLIESTNNRTAFSFAHNSSASLSYVSGLTGRIWFGTSSAGYGNTSNQGFEIGPNNFNAEVAVRNNGVLRVKDNIDNTEWNSGGIYYSEWDVSVVDVNSRSDNYKNNTSLTVSHDGSATSPIFEAASEKQLAFFGKSFGADYSNGNFSEMIIWQGLQTSNREGIYNDTNNYY